MTEVMAVVSFPGNCWISTGKKICLTSLTGSMHWRKVPRDFVTGSSAMEGEEFNEEAPSFEEWNFMPCFPPHRPWWMLFSLSCAHSPSKMKYTGERWITRNTDNFPMMSLILVYHFSPWEEKRREEWRTGIEMHKWESCFSLTCTF